MLKQHLFTYLCAYTEGWSCLFMSWWFEGCRGLQRTSSMQVSGRVGQPRQWYLCGAKWRMFISPIHLWKRPLYSSVSSYFWPRVVEYCGSDMFNLYYRGWVCDGNNDCGDNSDEADHKCNKLQCRSNEFMCADGSKCIPEKWKCDFDKDCPDGSDENCTHSTCAGDQFR